MLSEKDIEKLLESRILSSCENFTSIPKDYYYFKFSKRINTSINYSEFSDEEKKEYENQKSSSWLDKVDNEDKIPFLTIGSLPTSNVNIYCWFADEINNTWLINAIPILTVKIINEQSDLFKKDTERKIELLLDNESIGILEKVRENKKLEYEIFEKHTKGILRKNYPDINCYLFDEFDKFINYDFVNKEINVKFEYDDTYYWQYSMPSSSPASNALFVLTREIYRNQLKWLEERINGLQVFTVKYPPVKTFDSTLTHKELIVPLSLVDNKMITTIEMYEANIGKKVEDWRNGKDKKGCAAFCVYLFEVKHFFTPNLLKTAKKFAASRYQNNFDSAIDMFQKDRNKTRDKDLEAIKRLILNMPFGKL